MNPMVNIRNIKDRKKLKGWQIFHRSWNPINPVVATEMLE